MRLSEGLSSLKELNEAQGEIGRLQAENERLKKQLASASSNDVAEHIDTLFEGGNSSIVRIPIDDIRPFAGQPRKTFTKSTVKNMALSLKEEGQKDAIKLVHSPDETEYLLWDGEIRWRAAKTIEWDLLNAIVVEMPEDLHWEILKGFFVRHDLNSLDRAEAVVEAIMRKTEISSDLAPNYIRSGYRKIERSKDVQNLMQTSDRAIRQEIYSNSGLSDEQSDCIEQIMRLGLNLPTFVAKDIPLLSIPDDLKVAIRTQGISIGAAKVLKRLWSDPPKKRNLQEIKKELLKKGEQLSIAEAKKVVTNFYSPTQEKESVTKQLREYMKKIDIQAITIEEREELLTLIHKLVEKLESYKEGYE